MKVYTIVCPPLSSNTYVVANDDGRALVIDAACKMEDLQKIATSKKLKIEAMLMTHGHFDHAALGSKLKDAGIPTYIHKNDADKLTSFKNMAVFMGYHFNKFSADHLLSGGDVLEIAGFKIEVIFTPGHSEGGVCYRIENCLFTGDTIFGMGYGRTDFMDGSFSALKESAKKIFSIPENLTVYPGHGKSSTLDFERANNPINFDD